MNISIENPKTNFEEHLALPNNQRILFSGKFGTGKSHFLSEFFKQKEDNYNVFWIKPVDYVVGANQDIFEWIKIDIARQLLFKSLADEKVEQFPKSLTIQTYIYNNPGKIITGLLANLTNQVAKLKTRINISEAVRKQIDGYT